MTGACDAVARLQRWELSGARWRVLSRHGGAVTVALLTCDTGEEVDRLHSTDPAVLLFLGDRETSED